MSSDFEKVLIARGFTWDGKAWVPGKKPKPYTIIGKVSAEIVKDFARQVKRGRSSNNEMAVKDSVSILSFDSDVVSCTIILEGLAPGLNGSKGLMREHWSAKDKRKANYVLRLSVLKLPKFDKVRITYTLHCSLLMDWDNACASAKSIFDAMVKVGTLPDDSPKYIIEFIPKQIRCRRKDVHTEILIEKL